MKRGMLTILPNKIKQIIQFLPVNPPNQLLINKLQDGIKSLQNPTQILVSEEELDIIMDNLPIPTQVENPILTQARTTIQKKLIQLRTSS